MAYYATGPEQRSWLIELAANPLLWLLLNYPRERRVIRADIDAVKALSFMSGPGEVQMLLGCKRLCEDPWWRSVGERDEIDFKGSQAIQLVPALVQGDVLLEGHIAIMQKADYEASGMKFEPLAGWFRSVCKSLAQAIMAQEIALTNLSLTERPTRSRRKVLISPGAISWRENGKRLKQFAETSIEFDIPSKA